MKIAELQAITPEQLLRMNTKELQTVVKQLNKHVERRMSKLEQSGIENQSPAYRSIQKSGGKLKSDVKLNQLRSEFARGQRFLNQKTSTPTGVRSARTNVLKGIKKAAGSGKGKSTLSDAEFEKYEEAVSKLEEMYPNLRWQQYVVQEKMKEYTQEHPKANWWHIFKAGQKELDRLYEAEQRERNLINDIFEAEAELIE